MGRHIGSTDVGIRNKRTDTCFKCPSRRCYTRVVRLEEPFYDKVACNKHQNDLYLDADDELGTHNGIQRHYISSTGTLRRGDPVT